MKNSRREIIKFVNWRILRTVNGFLWSNIISAFSIKIYLIQMKILLVYSISNRLINSKYHMKHQIPIVVSEWNIWFLVLAYFMNHLFFFLINLIVIIWIIWLPRYLFVLINRLSSLKSYILRINFNKLFKLCVYW
jgi:hypothetical protein